MEKVLQGSNFTRTGSFQMGIKTVSLVMDIIKAKKFLSVQELVKLVNGVKNTLKQSLKLQFTIRNVIQRIQMIILEKASELEINEQQIFEMEDEDNQHPAMAELKFFILEAVDNLYKEIEQLSESINIYASSHINSNEIIVTFEYSTTILDFLIEGAKTRKFEVIVVESALEKTGHLMAEKLSKHGINTALIKESAIYAVMQRANKVFIGVHSIMNNGGSVCNSGALLLAMAAQSFSVPFIVISGIFKLTPKFPLGQGTYNEMVSPGQFFQRKDDDVDENIEVFVNKYNYIAPEYISLYITNFGEYLSAHIYRLFGDYYGSDDHKILLKQLISQA